MSWWRADGRIRIVVLRSEGIEPSPRRLESSWKEFLHRQAASILECDFLTVDTVFLKRFDILFVIELQSRRVHLADHRESRRAVGDPAGTQPADGAR